MKRLLSFLLFYLFVLFSGATFAQVTWKQTSHVFASSPGTSAAVAFAGVSTVHDLIVVDITWSGNTQTVKTVTDSKGNAYAKINGTTAWDNNNFSHELWYAYNIAVTAGAMTVTVTLSAAAVLKDGLNYIQLYNTEYSSVLFPANPLDQNCVFSGTGATGNFTSCSVTTTFGSEMIYSSAVGETMQNITDRAPFTQRNVSDGNTIEDENVTPTGAYSATYKNTAGGTYVTAVATFKEEIALPIELLSFSAQQNASVVDVDWATSTETNNAYFTVEKSQDGTDFAPVVTMDGAGNSSYNHYYSAVDNSPYSGTSYYRLKQTDYDGKFTYSDIVPVNYIPANDIVINYVTSNEREQIASVSSKENTLCTMELLDMQGRVVTAKVLTLTIGINSIPLTSISNGIYLLKLVGGNGTVVTKKFVHTN